MSLGIKRESGDTIYFDVITSYSPSYESTVSKHPIDGSGRVSDHITKDNPEVTFSGIISNWDFNTVRPSANAFPQEGQSSNVDQDIRIVNNRPVIQPVVVSQSAFSDVAALLPGSITQFLGGNLPTVTMLGERQDTAAQCKSLLLDIWNKRETFTLLEFDAKGLVVDSRPNCAITSLSFPEDAETGEALYVELTLEQITKVFLRSTEVPADVQKQFADKGAAAENKGVKQAQKEKGPCVYSTANTVKVEKGLDKSAFERARGLVLGGASTGGEVDVINTSSISAKDTLHTMTTFHGTVSPDVKSTKDVKEILVPKTQDPPVPFKKDPNC